MNDGNFQGINVHVPMEWPEAFHLLSLMVINFCQLFSEFYQLAVL